MLPDDLASSYSSYKADTSMFTNWLFKSAAACGYKMPTITTTTTENSSTPVTARKLTKESKERQKVQESVPVLRAPSKKYTITTTEILKQAKFGTGKIELPQTVRKVLQRAIHARKRCADWFESSKFGNQSSNKGDQHFIGLLHSSNTNVSCKASRKSQDTESSWTETSNSFQHLGIEDCLEEDSEVENDQESSKPNTDTSDTSDTCELEEEFLEMKMSLMIYYFFEDLHRIQDFLHGIWKRYKDKTLDLLSATLITNTAFELVCRSEQEFLGNAPKLFSKKRSYDTIAAVIFYSNGLNTGKDPTHKMELKEWLRPTPFDDFIYLSTARILMKYDTLCKMDPGYPIHSLPLRAAYISCPEILGTPYMDKKEKEDVLLSQLIIDLDLFDTYSRLTKGDEFRGPALYAPPAADDLTAGLLKLRDEGNISVTVVFASQIFLDLNEILGDNIREGREDWERYTNSEMFIKLKECFVQSYCSGPDWGKVNDNESTSTTGLVNRLNQESSSTSVLQPMASKNTYCTEQGNLPGLQFSKDLVLTNTYTRFPECGLRLSPRHDLHGTSVRGMCKNQLYQKRWPAMETMIKLHRKEIFDGNVPKSADEAYNIFSKHFFLSKVSDREYTRAKPSPNLRMPELSRNTLSQAIRPFLEHQATSNEATNNLQNLVQNLPSAVIMKDTNRRAKRQLTSLQFLHVLEELLPDEIPRIQFDYIALTLVCYRLLEKIRLGIDPTGKQNPKRTLPSGIEPAYLFMILDILSKGRTGGENPLLKVVAGVLEKFLEEEN
ncbi:hypothetical protein BCON_0120g00040 [Botryotinia convoluta]|uniref:DUF6604 domain-containing protein n=1 Tax=Botryotinia convoluta TaxID=54673 RepID=A0A4Z1IAC6_9HELO|nr:hypothetical protein BCON_0120g00040 [Botryotinia convoluta]